MSAVFLQNRVQSHFRLRFLMAFVFILMTFSIFWIHLGPNWALEAWARDTWFFMDSEGGSKIHSSLVVGGEASVWRPYYQLTISQLPAIYQANYLLTKHSSTADTGLQD